MRQKASTVLMSAVVCPGPLGRAPDKKLGQKSHRKTVPTSEKMSETYELAFRLSFLGLPRTLQAQSPK